ncbi:hypothetical protein L917_20211 [Phytophthora nicotianae]|nr:hypothetical protein L917_20211 [Phytophthora nicotianae]
MDYGARALFTGHRGKDYSDRSITATGLYGVTAIELGVACSFFALCKIFCPIQANLISWHYQSSTLQTMPVGDRRQT